MDDFKVKYANALGWAYKLWKTADGNLKEDLLHYFPELKKKEDQRVLDSILNEGNLKPSERDWLKKLYDQSLRIIWDDSDELGWSEAMVYVKEAKERAKDEGEFQNAVTAELWLEKIHGKTTEHHIIPTKELSDLNQSGKYEDTREILVEQLRNPDYTSSAV